MGLWFDCAVLLILLWLVSVLGCLLIVLVR